MCIRDSVNTRRTHFIILLVSTDVIKPLVGLSFDHSGMPKVAIDQSDKGSGGTYAVASLIRGSMGVVFNVSVNYMHNQKNTECNTNAIFSFRSKGCRRVFTTQKRHAQPLLHLKLLILEPPPRASL